MAYSKLEAAIQKHAEKAKWYIDKKIKSIDSEVQDIRVKADGTSAATAGNAVREQFTELKSAFNDNFMLQHEYLYGTEKSFVIAKEGHYEFSVLLLSGVSQRITNNTDNTAYVSAYKTDGTQVQLGTFVAGKTILWTPDDNDFIRIGGYFDGVGTLDIKTTYSDYGVVITPEMYGAFGDGVTDDSTYLQNAINDCISKNVPLYLSSKATYAIGSQIRIQDPGSNFRIFGNGAVIKAIPGKNLSTWTRMVIFDQDQPLVSYGTMNVFKDLILDCNETCSGIEIEYGFHFVFENIIVKNTRGAAVVCTSGGGCYFNNMLIYCLHNSGSSTGLQVQNSDYHFTDVVIIDADRAIYNSSSSMYTRVHAWNTSQCTRTYYFVHNSGYPILTQCHADTYEVAYYRETDRPLMLLGCVYYINSNLYDSSATPVVFKFTESSIPYSGNIKCVDCMFDALRTEVNMTESAHKIQLINCSKKGTINRYNNGVTLTLSNGAKDSGLKINANSISQEQDYLHYYFVLNLEDVDLTGTAAKTIGTISNTRFRPKTFLVYPCIFFTDEYATNIVTGYITVNNNNGVVQIKPNNAGTYKKLIADFKEYRPLALYES